MKDGHVWAQGDARRTIWLYCVWPKWYCSLHWMNIIYFLYKLQKRKAWYLFTIIYFPYRLEKRKACYIFFVIMSCIWNNPSGVYARSWLTLLNISFFLLIPITRVNIVLYKSPVLCLYLESEIERKLMFLSMKERQRTVPSSLASRCQDAAREVIICYVSLTGNRAD